MMTISRICAVVALGSTLLLPAHGADLLEIYQFAQQSDPLLREADANRLATLEARPQARSALLPQLSFSGSRTDQGRDGLNAQFGAMGFEDTVFDSDSDQDFFQLELRQTLFRWDQWLGLKQADKIVAQAEVDYSAAQQDLMIRVTTLYFDVLSTADDLESAVANKEAIARQLEQSETRFEVGLIAITDVEESRAAYDQAVAEEIVATRRLRNAQESLREVSGKFIEDLSTPGESLTLAAPDPASPEAWVERALEQNLNIVSSRLGVQIAKDSINVERAGHLPTLDLVVSRSEFDDETDQVLNGFANPTQADISTDQIQLQFTVPIYSGGRVSSQVREAVYRHRAAREQLERVARQTERQTRDAYLGVSADIPTIRALQQALSSAETALKATEAGFDVGTRTTVDVLDARRDLLTARTNLKRAKYDYIINTLQLKQAAGTLSGEDLIAVNRWLD